jgi:hypothetical protein
MEWLTDVEKEREFLVFVRRPDHDRDAASHLMLRLLGPSMPTIKWVSNSELAVAVPNGPKIVARSEGVQPEIKLTVLETKTP